MLLAYLDEIGSPGAFIGREHPRFNDCPAFGYGGFIIPEEGASDFGAYFAYQKRRFLGSEIPTGTDPGRWEKKGADLLYARVCEERGRNLRLLTLLISKLRALNGNLFYYVDEKPIGSPKETNCGADEFQMREELAMQETLNRIARHADFNKSRVLILMDQINEKARTQRVQSMYAHILGRASEHREMRRVIEPPMHMDSRLSSGIQFADWVCALIKRAIDYQLIEDSRYSWVPSSRPSLGAEGLFTYESKLHFYERDIGDLHHSQILSQERPIFKSISPGIDEENREKLERVRRAALGASRRR